MFHQWRVAHGRRAAARRCTPGITGTRQIREASQGEARVEGRESRAGYPTQSLIVGLLAAVGCEPGLQALFGPQLNALNLPGQSRFGAAST
ncbi:hypothetical protein NDU88_004618 [Pleurodeles waltl]|uniref:Uncharacterized protein n=1 Tax=Pleurodeles waltl TaxID=8319 RepID=A0AAV7QG32_PLEWA|nr:hypothetical protein NDU88_004618 [Pleurodeles waltl]